MQGRLPVKGPRMTYRGHVKNGVVILDPPADLPEGAQVEVCLMGRPAHSEVPGDREAVVPPAWAKKAIELSRRMPRDLPEDLAEQHDHYIHGTPKR